MVVLSDYASPTEKERTKKKIKVRLIFLGAIANPILKMRCQGNYRNHFQRFLIAQKCLLNIQANAECNLPRLNYDVEYNFL